MSTPLKLAGFAALLALVFGVAAVADGGLRLSLAATSLPRGDASALRDQ